MKQPRPDDPADDGTMRLSRLAGTVRPGLGIRWSSVSLARRVTLAAALWGLFVLIGGALVLSALYRAQTLSLVEEDLEQTLVTLSRELTREEAFLPDGRVTDTGRSFLASDARYQTQYSGHYWAVAGIDAALAITGDIRSRSLWDEALPLPDGLISRAAEMPGTTQFGDYDGPAGQRTRVAVRAIIVDRRPMPLILIAAADRTPGDKAANRFRNLLLGTMIALFGGVFAAMLLAVRYSLDPLSRLEADIASIREGNSERLRGDYPVEVLPLTEELNKLIDHNHEVVDRARTHVGNLAHALKTPIAVLRNEATGQTLLDDVVRRQTDTMQASVSHYLKRARMAARAEVLGARTPVRTALDGLARMFNRLFDAQGIEVSVEGGDGAVFRGEQQDFEEMAGNLMENACKWAASRVEVRISEEGQGLRIDFDDDGPGLTPDERAGAIRRGVRLDETMPGSGLGLSIVNELTELHKGSLELSDAPIGGLRVTLRFPRP